MDYPRGTHPSRLDPRHPAFIFISSLAGTASPAILTPNLPPVCGFSLSTLDRSPLTLKTGCTRSQIRVSRPHLHGLPLPVDSVLGSFSEDTVAPRGEATCPGVSPILGAPVLGVCPSAGPWPHRESRDPLPPIAPPPRTQERTSVKAEKG